VAQGVEHICNFKSRIMTDMTLSVSADAITTRRNLLMVGAGIATAGLTESALAQMPRHEPPSTKSTSHSGPTAMTTLTLKDGTKLYYKDWGTGPVVTFSHGWPLSADAWDAQMLFLAGHGCRVIAHDRRGHGRSDQTWDGNDMDTYADDLAALLDHLNVHGATMVGHSTGGGEVARYIGRHGTSRVAKAVLISAVPPYLAHSDDNPDGAPMSIFDGLRANVIADRAQFFKDLAMPFFGYNRSGAKVSEGQIGSFWMQGMMGGVKCEYDCIKAFSETDFRADLKKMTMPTMLIQGDDDQIVPIALASRRSIKILPHGTLKEYPGAPHGLCVTHAEKVNADLLEFVKS
jgi:non-heme chloroperoxidase